MRPLALFVILCGFWALLSGQLDPHHNLYLMGSGVVCCAFTTWMAVRLGIVDEEGMPLRIWPRLVRYAPYLFKEIILANLDVARRVWAVDMPINPRLVKVPYATRSAFATTVYANSITITPGTVTIDVQPEYLLVHALTDEAAEGVTSGEMEAQVRLLEGA